MQFTKIALAAAVTLVASQAQAATVFLAGASASKAASIAALKSKCGGTATVITYNGPTSAAITSAGNLYAVKCSQDFTGLSGIDAVSYNVDGGSFSALYTNNTVATNAQQVQFVNFATPTGSGDTATSGTLIPARYAEGGFLDIDVAAFPADQFATYGIDPATTAAPTNFNQVFGLAVSPMLYTALQSSQGLTGCTVDSFTAACQPTISKAQYASIVSDAFNSAKTKGAQFLISTLPANTQLVVCRRVPTSGTQAVSNAYFLNAFIGGDGAAAGALTPADAATYDGTVGSGAANIKFIENGTTGNARDCLSGNAPVSATYAIGVLSLENKPTFPGTSDKKYRYVKINGVDAFNNGTNNSTAKAGSYEFFFNSVKFGATTNGTNVLNAIDSALGPIDQAGGFDVPASSNTGTAKRDSNTSPVVFN